MVEVTKEVPVERVVEKIVEVEKEVMVVKHIEVPVVTGAPRDAQKPHNCNSSECNVHAHVISEGVAFFSGKGHQSARRSRKTD